MIITVTCQPYQDPNGPLVGAFLFVPVLGGQTISSRFDFTNSEPASVDVPEGVYNLYLWTDGLVISQPVVLNPASGNEQDLGTVLATSFTAAQAFGPQGNLTPIAVETPTDPGTTPDGSQADSKDAS